MDAQDIDELYAVHAAVADHPLAKSDLGGLAGWKVGAVGALGQPCIYAPLFRRFIVSEADSKALTASSVQMHQVEPEFVLTLREDLEMRPDRQPHRPADVWAALESIALGIECCGQRGAADVMAAQTPLGRFQDVLAAGGLVIGQSLPMDGVTPAGLSECVTTLSVNGKVVARGAGDKCPEGGPVEATAFLANALNLRGLALRKGHVVATGQTCMTREFAVGDKIGADFIGMGSVQMAIEQ
eukprot:gnl/TRDRNA2_/TRDRNA2_162329_c0_seq2.p1 gnl/TRDRNA2_/TRDRNA2_162329_c0~~gnl/TRDRNA2_/TRDRNA2_162329_c0_seq2.p1  ORF type:complete len:263 (+),score=49.72 gnl/TRDRNA2_/TRDRNA2_162329_c0_seq2:67-789(+)